MNSTSRTALLLLSGAVVGAVVALLLAPQSGEETRSMISDTAKKVKDTVGDTIQQGVNKISGLRADGVLNGRAEAHVGKS